MVAYLYEVIFTLETVKYSKIINVKGQWNVFCNFLLTAYWISELEVKINDTLDRLI